jgi:hypothetical protein
MKLRLTFLAALSGALVWAQAPPPKDEMAFQQIVVMDKEAGNVTMHMMAGEGMHGQTVTGKPFSATEQHHSLQILGDGTRIENTETNAFYRDDQGRTRVEHGAAGNVHAMIHDPVAGYSLMLDPTNKVAHKLTRAKLPPDVVPDPPPAMHEAHMAMSVGGGGSNVFYHRTEVKLGEPVKEDLGTQTINGIVAHGTRTTLTIPAGKIGNDRPIQVVNERWYSNDLQTLVKSVNNDPRFGETDYELTTIDRSSPSASLFQVPSDYKVEEDSGPKFFTHHGPPPAAQ